VVRILKWVGLSLGGPVVLLVLAALILPSLVNVDRYRNLVASRASRALGREVRLGALRVSLWPVLGAEAKGIQIAQASGFGDRPFLTADELQIGVQWLPLLRGQVKVSTAVLDRPHIWLARVRDGQWNVQDLLRPQPAHPSVRPPGEAPRTEKATILSGLLLSKVAVQNGDITLLDQDRPKPVTFTLSNLDLSLRQAAFSAPIDVRVAGKIAGPGTGRFETTGRIELKNDPAGPILDATITLQGFQAGPWEELLLGAGNVQLTGPLSAELKLTGPVTKAAFTGRLDLKRTGIQVGDRFRKPVGVDASLRFQGQREGAGVTLSTWTLALGSTVVDGSLRILDLQAPRLVFAATSANLDLDRLLKPMAKSAWLGPSVAWAAPPPLPRAVAPSGLAVDGRVSIGELHYHGLVWTGVQTDLRYQDGVLQLPSIQADFLNGKIAARGEADLRPKTPRVTLTAKLESVATEPLVKALVQGAWTLQGTLSTESHASFAGSTLPAILGTAAGDGSILLKNGRLTGYKPLDRLVDFVTPILASQGVQAHLHDFEQLSGHYTVDKGVLRTNDLTLVKPEGTVTAAGSLGLLDESLNFDVVAKLGRSTIVAKVTGTTSKPIVIPKSNHLQQRIETQVEKILPGEQGKGLKDILKGLLGR
jgi:AsmA protein